METKLEYITDTTSAIEQIWKLNLKTTRMRIWTVIILLFLFILLIAFFAIIDKIRNKHKNVSIVITLILWSFLLISLLITFVKLTNEFNKRKMAHLIMYYKNLISILNLEFSLTISENKVSTSTYSIKRNRDAIKNGASSFLFELTSEQIRITFFAHYIPLGFKSASKYVEFFNNGIKNNFLVPLDELALVGIFYETKMPKLQKTISKFNSEFNYIIAQIRKNVENEK